MVVEFDNVGAVVGEFVRAVRLARGLSLSQLAEVSGVAKANISAIENGRRTPSAETLNRLVVACGYELAAVAGARTLYCPLPGGLFPDDDVPAAVDGDPDDEAPVLGSGASDEDRSRALEAALSLVDAIRR